MGSWIGDKVSDFFGGIVDGAKDLLGIHSPSTVFAGIGSNMGAGIGIGFTDAMNGVERDMKNAIPTNFDVNANVNGSGGANTVNHTGVIRVEGVNDSGVLSGIVDIIIGELRKEVRV